MRVYIFGAGASKAEGAPTTNELLTQAINSFPRDGRARAHAPQVLINDALH